MTPYVLLATPSFAGHPCIEYQLSMLQTVRSLNEAGIGWDLCILAGDPYLSKVRNRLMAKFLSEFPHATDFMFLDDDIGWDPDKVVEFVRRDEDIVFGCYPHKKDALSFPVTLRMTDDRELIEKDGLYQAELAPTGFMRIKRRVLETMASNVGQYMEAQPDGSELIQWNICEARFVDPLMEELRVADLDGLTREEAIANLKRAIGLTKPTELGKYWGEDFWLVERWTQMGGTVWCDPEIGFSHRGSKVWRAKLGDSLRATIARMKEQNHEATDAQSGPVEQDPSVPEEDASGGTDAGVDALAGRDEVQGAGRVAHVEASA